MRLIDANELKEAISTTPYNDYDDLTRTEKLIDNAPTVEYTFEEAFQKTVCEQKLYCPKRPQGDLIKAFELLKAHCKNRECNKDCVFYRELRTGNNIEQFCGLCEIVTSDDSENENKNP